MKEGERERERSASEEKWNFISGFSGGFLHHHHLLHLGNTPLADNELLNPSCGAFIDWHLKETEKPSEWCVRLSQVRAVDRRRLLATPAFA